MKFFSVAALAMVAVGAGAQSTVLAPCGTDCPSAVPDKTITRSRAMPTETAPCPSVIVSKISGAANGTNPMVQTTMPGSGNGASPNPPPFTGGAGQVAAPMGAALAACAAFLAL